MRAPSVGGTVLSGRTVTGVRLQGLSIKARLIDRGKRRSAITISFRLSRAARLFLLVRGPGPGCSLTARIPLAAPAGVNRVPFVGTARNRRLAPGTYVLTVRLRRTGEDLARTFVRVIVPGSPIRTGVKPRCSESSPSQAPVTLPSVLGGRASGSETFATADGTVPSRASRPGPTATRTPKSARLALLGPAAGSGPPLFGPIAGPSDAHRLLEVLMLALMTAAFLGLVAALTASRPRRWRF